MSAAETAGAYSLGTGASATLAPGIYGDVTLQPSSTLTLGAGVYHMKSFRLKSGAKILVTGRVQIRVRRGATGDNSSVIMPRAGSSVRPQDILIYIGGTDAQSAFTYALNISPKSTITANVLAPNGTVYLSQGTTCTGAFFGKVVQIGTGVKLSLASSFAGSTSSAKVIAAVPPEISDAKPAVPTKFELAQNYPNPFNPTTSIRFALPQESFVTLSIYNVLGQEVARLVDGLQPQGFHEVLWNGTSRNGIAAGSGIYFYRIKAGEFTDVRKMLMLK